MVLGSLCVPLLNQVRQSQGQAALMQMTAWTSKNTLSSGAVLAGPMLKSTAARVSQMALPRKPGHPGRDAPRKVD